MPDLPRVAAVPGSAIAADQPYRETDLAIDYCEDVPPLPLAAAERIADLMRAAGLQAKVSSIHVNGWFGDYDKLAMTRRLFADEFHIELERERSAVVYVGGVDYLVFCSTPTTTQLPPPGGPTRLLIETLVREDHMHL